MNLIETMLSAAHGGVGQQLAQQFGIGGDQVSSVMAAVAPALAGGLKEKLASPSGGGLLEMLTSGALTKFASNPTALATPAAAQQGQSILDQIFGGNPMTSLISGLAQKSGLSSGLIQSMLPVVTSLVMGLLSQKAAGGNTIALMDTLGALTGEHAGVFGALKAAAHKMFG
ncbi:MAG: DUF937 domain-containing protein [Acidobacteriaceae bacterium]|nr:DUF937 domain-containing protein [Acidobacteriaceae bacterium]